MKCNHQERFQPSGPFTVFKAMCYTVIDHYALRFQFTWLAQQITPCVLKLTLLEIYCAQPMPSGHKFNKVLLCCHATLDNYSVILLKQFHLYSQMLLHPWTVTELDLQNQAKHLAAKTQNCQLFNIHYTVTTSVPEIATHASQVALMYDTCGANNLYITSNYNRMDQKCPVCIAQ